MFCASFKNVPGVHYNDKMDDMNLILKKTIVSNSRCTSASLGSLSFVFSFPILILLSNVMNIKESLDAIGHYLVQLRISLNLVDNFKSLFLQILKIRISLNR